MQRQPFVNRRDAGTFLAAHLSRYRNRTDVVVLGLPRGGVPVAYEVAHALKAPLDVFVVRKLGLPAHRELAMGAIASGGVRFLNDDVIASHGVPADTISAVEQEQQVELDRRERVYRDGRPLIDLHGRVAILVDDGLATGATMKAAVLAVRALAPSRIVVAVPVGPSETCRELALMADDMVCAMALDSFSAVGEWYDDFTQTTDEEIGELMREADRWDSTSA